MGVRKRTCGITNALHMRCYAMHVRAQARLLMYTLILAEQAADAAAAVALAVAAFAEAEIRLGEESAARQALTILLSTTCCVYASATR